MSIEKVNYVKYRLSCDICEGDIFFEDCDSIAEYKKLYKWESCEDDGGQYDVCPDCIAKR